MKYNTLFICISLLLTLLQVNAYLKVVKNNEYYVDSQSKCTDSCGSKEYPFKTFSQAFKGIQSNLQGASNTPTLIVNQGDYFGEENKDLLINFDIDIISQLGSEKTIIDCQKTGFGFKLTGPSNVMIRGLTIKNCVAGLGAAIKSDNILTNLKDIVFADNAARQGSAIYSTASMTLMTSCSFIKNKGKENTNAVFIKDGYAKLLLSKFFVNNNDVYCSNSSIVTSKGSAFGSICNDCQIVDQDRSSYCAKPKATKQCNRDGYCDSQIENFENCPSDCNSVDSICNNNQVCDLPSENVQNCPSDCDISDHPGWKLEYYESRLPKPTGGLISYPINGQVDYLDLPHILDFMGMNYPPVSGQLKSDIVVPTSDEYTFKLDLKNLAAIVLINGRILFDNYFQDDMPTIVHERTLLLSPRLPYTIEIVFTAINDQQRDLGFYWKSSQKPEYTLVPSYHIKNRIYATCGDGMCNEIPESCLVDCYDQIEKECPAQSPPSKLQEFYGPIKDTLGQLIDNQYIFSLPGIGFLSHGIDIRTGNTLPSPLFSHNYCDNSSFTVVHAPHRGLVYSVPPGLHAQISPKCTMDTSTKSYASSSLMAKEMSQDRSLDVSLSASYGGFYGSVTASASLSLSESVKKASELEKKLEGSIHLTELKCETSKVNLVGPIRFHPRFIKDLAATFIKNDSLELKDLYVKTVDRMKGVVRTFGTAYYTSATLGGKLEQVSVVSRTFERSKTSQEIDRSMDMSFSVSASSKILPVRGSASMSGSIDSKTSREDQDEYEKSSKRSTLIVSGGQPGSYGEDDFNSLHTWARTIDMIPFPIDYKAGKVADIIPKDWYLFSNNYQNISASDVWTDAEFEILKDYYLANPFKLTWPLELSHLQHLTRFETLYYFNSTCFVNPSTKVVVIDRDGNRIESKFLKQQVLLTTINDAVGIEAIEIYNSDGTQMSCSYQLTNFLTNRKYEFVFDSAKQMAIEALYPPNVITINLYNPHTVSPYTSLQAFSLAVTLFGEFKSITTHIEPDFTGDHVITNIDEYIGKIIGAEFSIIPNPFLDPENEEHKKIGMEFYVLTLTQTCPSYQSDCYPANAKVDRGYKRVIEVREDQFIVKFTKPRFISVPDTGFRL
ncbi:hypothetical protein CYY_001039 [Polysphondylium violaceum]|uniref:MACPF domain-containing protein n=1 Tax=Polysphondylium violaceum TaxID=133409 RepID=A0A8J4Q3S4_9MYCE|nr:hypothetical protein CYY_001039 [Polysphondylium violaceum]